MEYDLQALHSRIHENEKHKRYFMKEITPRFADSIYQHRVHFSKFFEFFEMARFDIMHGFSDVFCAKTGRTGAVSIGNFVVVRANAEQFQTPQLTDSDHIRIATALILHQKPLLEFEQLAFLSSSDRPVIQANLKIAIVDENFTTVDRWDLEILDAMLDYIEQHGEEMKL